MGKQETFSLPSSLPSLTCKFLFLCAKKIISFSRPLKKTYKKNCTEGPCVVLCGIKTANTGKEPFQKALRSILDYCGRKPCQSPKKVFFFLKKIFVVELSIKINAPYYIHVFLLYIKDEIMEIVRFSLLFCDIHQCLYSIKSNDLLKFPSLLNLPQDFDFISRLRINAQLRTQTL